MPDITTIPRPGPASPMHLLERVLIPHEIDPGEAFLSAGFLINVSVPTGGLPPLLRASRRAPSPRSRGAPAEAPVRPLAPEREDSERNGPSSTGSGPGRQRRRAGIGARPLSRPRLQPRLVRARPPPALPRHRPRAGRAAQEAERPHPVGVAHHRALQLPVPSGLRP